MMQRFFDYAPVAGLLFFFIFFLAVAAYAYRPAMKEKFQGHGLIPLRGDDHE